MQLGQGPRDNYLARAVLAQVSVAIFQTLGLSHFSLEAGDQGPQNVSLALPTLPSRLPMVNVPIPSEVGKVPEQALWTFLVAPSSPSPWKWQQAQP